MEFGLIFIIIIVIGLFSAASKSKKQQDKGSGQQPPRPTMSDIQRAFMMMTGIEEEKEEQPQSPAYSRPFVPPAPAPAAAAVHKEGHSDYGTVSSGSMNTASLEGRAHMSSTLAGPVSSRLEDAYEPEDVPAIEKASLYGDDLILHDTVDEQSARPALRLFENQNDYVKAVIYSEILSRKRSRRA